LREIALLRLRHPTASIAELARRCKPAMSKAAAYRRLLRLQELSGS
jgi:DNA-binding transcriptional regulator WhiA